MKKNAITSGIFQLVETPSVDGLSESVYSILALYPDGSVMKSRFMYDVSRRRDRAEQIFSEAQKSSPKIESLLDFICELL